MKVYDLIIKDNYPEPYIMSCDGPSDFFLSYNPTFQRHLREDGFLFINFAVTYISYYCYVLFIIK